MPLRFDSPWPHGPLPADAAVRDTSAAFAVRLPRAHGGAPADKRHWLVVLVALALAGCAAPHTNAAFQATAEEQKRIQAEAATAEQKQPSLDNQATYLRVVDQMQQSELWFASLAHIDALEQRWGVSPESTRLRADALRQTGQLTDAAVAYERLRGTPLAWAGLHGLGLLAGNRADFGQAVQLLEQARQVKPADPLVLGDLGYALLRAGDAGQARLRLMQALQLKPDNVQAQLNLALYFETRNETAQAQTVMDAHRMTASMRQAVRVAAAQITGRPVPQDVGSLAAPATAYTTANTGTGTATSPADAGAPPLALKASGWSGLSRVRAEGAVAAPASPAASPAARPEAAPAALTPQTLATASTRTNQEATP